MYRALYAHKSKLPKYLSFEAGDKFTLIDTSVSDQWFLAQNGLGEIGYVPFNYIKRIDATTEQQVKFIDGGMEAIHLQATSAGGQYTQEQRLVMKKLVKHRSDVIKRASATESPNAKESGRRRPAPAPPIEKTTSVDAMSSSKPSALAVIGRSVTVASSSSSAEHRSKQQPSGSDLPNGKQPESRKSQSRQKASEGHSKSKRASTASETVRPSSSASKQGQRDNVKKSVSVTSSIGQAPSLVSSMSSQSTDLDCQSEAAVSMAASGVSSDSAEFHSRLTPTDNPPPPGNANSLDTTYDSVEVSSEGLTSNHKSTEFFEMTDEMVEPLSWGSDAAGKTDVLSSANQGGQPCPPTAKSSPVCSDVGSNKSADVASLWIASSCEESHTSTASSSLAGVNDLEYDHAPATDDLPPPPPPPEESYYSDIGDGDGYSDYSLPPAPDMVALETGQQACLDTQLSVESESDGSDQYQGPNVMQECCCEDFQPPRLSWNDDDDGTFYARGSLDLPSSRRVEVTPKERDVVDCVLQAFVSQTANFAAAADMSLSEKQRVLEQLERAQANSVNVTHADCEEMIGKFQQVSELSHDESHWALFTALNLFAAKVPHIKPSLEVLALRFSMAHECQSTGRDYQSEDASSLDHLISQLDRVMNDSQQRGHYLEDDLCDITHTITQLSETLKKAKHCVSLCAIQKENFAMIEVIAKYYQMETRWPIRALLLDLVEIICRLNHQAIPEFLYSVLPLELVAEMQQYSNDDVRFMQVAKTLGVIFMRGKASPHKLSLTMDLHFFIWLLGMIESYDERCRHDDVEWLVALVCSYHLQHRDEPQNPVTEALKMAQGHALLECSLLFLSKHDDPTRLLGSTVTPKVNSVILLLTHLYDSSDTSDLLYTNDVEALIGIFEEFFRDLSSGDSLRKEMLHLLRNFLRCYPDTVSLRDVLCQRLGPLLVSMKVEAESKGKRGLASQILEDNRPIFED